MDETVPITLRVENAGMVIKDSPVLMSGVRVGYVGSIDLLKDQNGTVVVELGIQLFAEHKDKILDQNSTFFIKSSGFLGDQYIGVTPNQGPPVRALLEKKGWLRCEKPFDIEETGQSVAKLLEHVDVAVIAITNFVEKIDQELLSDDTVTNLTMTIADFRETSKSVKEISDGHGEVGYGIIAQQLLINFLYKVRDRYHGHIHVFKKFGDTLAGLLNIKWLLTPQPAFFFE
jgi:ABC-type transporter Mla subunit MlaD